MLVVHRAARGHDLVRGLADLLGDPPDDPFTPDVVAVPAAGVERWLAQRLSHVIGTGPLGDDGVCAHVRLTRLPRLESEILQAAAPQAAEDAEAWDPGRTRWHVRELLGVDVATAARLAGLFAGYERARPAMVLAWARGHDTDGTDRPVPDDLAWQPGLWRDLRDRVGVPSPAEHLEAVCAAVRDGGAGTGLPRRLSVYGPTRMSAARLRLLDALGTDRDIHLWLHHASPARWAREADRDAAPTRAARTAVAERGHPLLDSMARDVGELHDALRVHTAAQDAEPLGAGTDPGTLLQRLQHDVATDALPDARPAGRVPLDPADRSVQVHACHGRTRQVEVLREVVLGLLADDPTLEPRDVIVMCPDVEAFAPAIAATFDQALHPDAPDDDRTHPASRLRISLADRAPSQTNPLLGLLGDLLDLATSRVTAAAVLDLAAHPAVRRRHGLGADDVDRLREWVETAGVRWGLDADHRGGWDLDLADGTWRQGIDRLVLGAAVELDPALPEDDAPSPVVEHDGQPLTPADGVDGTDLELLGRLAVLVDALSAAHAFVSEQHDLPTWVDGLTEHVRALAAVPPSEVWHEVQLGLELDAVRETAAAGTSPLSAADVRDALAPAIAGRPTRTGFRTGSLTFCTLVPMRSVPHRVVCLLGLDDTVFPRQSGRDGDDVLARDPWVGERDPRSEDRQLLLDAVCAAGETLVVTYAGASETDGAAVPPAVPLAELLDVLDRTATAPVGSPAGGRVRDHVVTRHPLQPFDWLAYAPGVLVGDGPFGFDPLGLAGARAVSGRRHAPAPLLAEPLSEPAEQDVALTDLVRLLVDPAAAVLRQRLGVGRPDDDEDPSGTLDLDLDPLARWDVGDRLLRQRLRRDDDHGHAEALALERGRGTLPPGALGERTLLECDALVDRLLATARGTGLLDVDPGAVDVEVPLPGGTRVVGTVNGVRGTTVLEVHYSRLAAKHRLAAWARLLALAASDPDRRWSGVVVGRGQARGQVAARRLVAPPAERAHAEVVKLVRTYRHGLATLLPTPVGSTEAYVASGPGDDAEARRRAEQKWAGQYGYPGERDAEPYRLVLGDRPGLDALVPDGRWQDDPRVQWIMRSVWGTLLHGEGPL